jgi:gamma-glutamyl-gamma-aminobutyrate hydrolase PuuD
MQMMNVALGGTLIQEISTISSIPHSYSQHELVWNTHTVFPNRCNSRHHQCLDAIAKGIIVVARSVDGIPEVIFGRKMFGIQSHPENDAKWREVFTWHTENFALDT